jgi:IstB-like ATP binding protein
MTERACKSHARPDVRELDLPDRESLFRARTLVLTSNRGFADWGQVFADQVVAGHIVDRLLHNATVVDVRGHSRRTRNYMYAHKATGGHAGTVR